MKPILMMGSAAYSPFRLDALRAALAAADKALANVSIDARWVYAIDPEGEGPDAETLERAALLLNAENGEWGTGGVLRDAAQGYDFAVVVEGHRYLPQLRFEGHRAR